ncbi:MAG: macro domain-containing protein [Chloroflexota bacterium]
MDLAHIRVVEGDLLDQKVDAIVNPWNRNIIPWWLLLPKGVSRAIKKQAGNEPFRELARHGRMQLGQAIITGAGELPYRGIIHVAGINMTGKASKQSIQTSVVSAVEIAKEHDFQSIAFPVIGSGSGMFSEEQALGYMHYTLEITKYEGQAIIVKYRHKD